jgi:hypothetical protein
MPLIRMHPELGATKFLVQASHYRTAIGAAVKYVNAGFPRSPPEHTSDSLSSEWLSIEHRWVIETIYQGAYLRQYHLWEKSCTEYFSAMGVQMKPPNTSFTEHVKRVLSSSQFGLVVPEDVKVALCTMRRRVNRMKHEGGVEDDEFVSAAEYGEGAAAIERFWEFLVENEQVTVSKDAS